MKKKFRIALVLYGMAVLAYVSYLLFGYYQSVQDRNNLRQLSSLVQAVQTTSAILETAPDDHEPVDHDRAIRTRSYTRNES
jgi:hypothetical protein